MWLMVFQFVSQAQHTDIAKEERDMLQGNVWVDGTYFAVLVVDVVAMLQVALFIL